MHIQQFSLLYFSKKSIKVSIFFLTLLPIWGSYVHAVSQAYTRPITEQQPVINKQLVWAIQENNLKKVIALIRDGTNINNQDFLGYSPLHYAAKYAKEKVVACLIEAKALLDQVSARNGNTPLLLATRRGHKNIVSLLLAANANPNIVNHKGYYPLHFAIQKKRENLLKLLLEAGANCSIIPSPLLMAVKIGSLSVVQALLQQKQIVETRDSNGYTELHWAAKHNLAAIFQALLNSGRFNINAKAANGVTPLHFIVANKSGSKLLKTLLSSSYLQVNAEDSTGSTPLHYAVVTHQVKVVDALLGYPGIDVNRPNNRGQTPLHYAVQSENLNTLKKLLPYASKSLWIKNKENVTPLELAMSHENHKVYQLMLTHISSLSAD